MFILDRETDLSSEPFGTAKGIEQQGQERKMTMCIPEGRWIVLQRAWSYTRHLMARYRRNSVRERFTEEKRAGKSFHALVSYQFSPDYPVRQRIDIKGPANFPLTPWVNQLF